jgi:rhodanese-related sulfurtransferase
MVHNLSREDLIARMAEDSVILIDVREPHEFAMGHIPGALLMPLSQFDPVVLPPPGDRTLVFSCAAGVRSLRAIDLARAAGVEVDTHYAGGFKDWLMAGEPVEQG